MIIKIVFFFIIGFIEVIECLKSESEVKEVLDRFCCGNDINGNN